MLTTLKETLKQEGFRGASRIGSCNVEDTIVVSGSPRSGTTWVLELLHTLSGYKAMNEPLMYEEARREHGFSWRTLLAPDASAPRQREYLEAILRGQLRETPAWHYASTSYLDQLWEQATGGKLVVKFCRLNRMLHWFVGQFEVQGIVFVVRHPCAVVASMKRHGAWDEENVEADEFREYAEPYDGLPPSLETVFAPILDRIETRNEALATLWSLDHYVPLLQQGKNSFPWILLPYERLVTRGYEELDRITQALGVEMTEQMKSKLDAPSSSVKDQIHASAEHQLSKWQRRLSTEQVSSILSIVEEVGLSQFYTHDLEPDYEALRNYQQPSARWKPASNQSPQTP